MTPTNMTPTARTAHDLHMAFNEGALDRCLEMVTEDVEVVFQAHGQVLRGREGFMQFMHVFRQAFPDIRIRPVNYVGDAEQVSVECTWTGTHTGPLVSPAGTIPPTGKQVTDGRFCEVMRVRGGKVARLTNYQDISWWLRQLGVVP